MYNWHIIDKGFSLSKTVFSVFSSLYVSVDLCLGFEPSAISPFCYHVTWCNPGSGLVQTAILMKFPGCSHLDWLSTWQHLKITNTQASGQTCVVLLLLLGYLGWKSHLKHDPHLVAAHTKGHRRRMLLLVACLFSLSLASSSIMFLNHSLADVITYFFRILK